MKTTALFKSRFDALFSQCIQISVMVMVRAHNRAIGALNERLDYDGWKTYHIVVVPKSEKFSGVNANE